MLILVGSWLYIFPFSPVEFKFVGLCTRVQGPVYSNGGLELMMSLLEMVCYHHHYLFLFLYQNFSPKVGA